MTKNGFRALMAMTRAVNESAVLREDVSVSWGGSMSSSGRAFCPGTGSLRTQNAFPRFDYPAVGLVNHF